LLSISAVVFLTNQGPVERILSEARSALKLQVVPLGAIYTRSRYRSTLPEEPGVPHRLDILSAERVDHEPSFDATILRDEDSEALHSTLVALVPLGVLEALVLAVIAFCKSGGLAAVLSVVPTASPALSPGGDKTPSKGEDSVRPHVQVVLASASPRYIHAATQRRELLQLPGRDIEMRKLNKLLGRQLHLVPAAVWPEDLQQALERTTAQGNQLKVLILSGHYIKNHWAAEHPSGSRGTRLVSSQDVAKLLMDHGAPELLVLNGCSSYQMAQQLAQEMAKNQPQTNLHIVSCNTQLLHDDFAAAFAHTLCACLVSNPLSTIQQAFADACSCFEQAESKFQMGEPADYRHPSTALAGKSESSPSKKPKCEPYNPACTGCNPPVHGRFVLLNVQSMTA